jgi:flagellar basal-body rod protein FlgB
MTSRLDNALAFHSQALNLRAHRQQVLAANIANADTPHYKARDFDFKSALGEALAGKGINGLEMSTTSGRHLQGSAGPSTASLRFRSETQSSVDGNTVDMDIERAQFSDNAIQYEASVTFVSGLLRAMTDAMQPVR